MAVQRHFPGRDVERIIFRLDEQGSAIKCQPYGRDGLPLTAAREMNADGQLSDIVFTGLGNRLRNIVRPDGGTYMRAAIDADYKHGRALVEVFYQRNAEALRYIETHTFTP